MAHEAGHAFGMSHEDPAIKQSEYRVTEDALMRARYRHSRQICKPTVYDVVAMMANYQSPRQGG